MRKGFVVVMVLAAVVGLVWFGWQIYKPIPENRPYAPKPGEVVSQSDHARGEVAKIKVEPPKPEPEPAPTILAQPASVQPAKKRTGRLVVEGNINDTK